MAACLLLVGLSMTQQPGRIVADTKLDLAVAPLSFLGRALHLWDPLGAFGQLQNQAYGYLWPMGPFFALGELIDLPAWVTQRLWMALVLCVAFVGAALVARALGVRSDLACVSAGFLFALSPRMLTVIGPSSIEVWPGALVPWVLLPLVVGAERGSPRRAAALSALAIAMVGGVNAAATSAVLPLGAVWLLTRTRGPRRRALMLWWPAFTLLATLWWLIPLFVLGAYSPPFLEFIESASVTTAPTDLFDALRGTSHWVPYVDAQSPAGLDLLREPHYVLNSAVLMVLGLGGIVLRRNPHRMFLVAGTLVGLLLVTMGHLGPAQGLLAEQLNSLLDTVLAPLRNVHKFDPVIRLPLVVGVAWALEEALTRLRSRRTTSGLAADRTAARVLIGSTLLGVLVTTLPVAMGDVASRGSFAALPGYWRAAAAWLEDSAGAEEGVTLLLPGSSFGTYVWGEPRDEPLQPLAGSPWAVRNAVPLAPAGNIRMLSEIEQRIAEGDGGPELTSYLRRAGVSHLLVRNDLERSNALVDPVLVHQAIEQSPGIRRAARFGPEIGGEPEVDGDLGRALINGGWQTSYPALEVYEVSPAPSRARSLSDPTTVIGGPEDLLDLSASGLVEDDPTVLATDADPDESRPGQLVLTDGLRRVERQFAALHDATSPTLTRDDELVLDRLAPDYELPGQSPRWETVARYVGAREVAATSSASNPGQFTSIGPGRLPYAAIDGDPDTAWVSSRGEEPQRWWVELDEPVDARDLSVTLGLGMGNEQLRLRTDDWSSPILDFAEGETRRLTGPPEATTL